jgi:predicted transcriptional regulator
MQLSPLKLSKSPDKASLLPLGTLARLPYVCPWCLVWFTSELKNHITSSTHKGHMFHEKYKMMQKDHPEQFNRAVTDLNKQGRLRNNKRALEKKDRNIIPIRRAKANGKVVSSSKTMEYIWCTLCSAAVTKKGFRESHIASCAKNKELVVSKEASSVLAKKASPVFHTEDQQIELLLKDKEGFYKEVLFPINKDRLALTHFALEDKVANALVSRMASGSKSKNSWVPKIRLWLRLLFNIFQFFVNKYGAECSSVTYFMQYDKWHVNGKDESVPLMIECCHFVCGLNKETHEFARVNDVMTMSSLLQSTADITLNHLHHEKGDNVDWCFEATKLQNFLTSETWKLYTVRNAAVQKAKQINYQKVMVDIEDYKFFLNFVESLSREAYTRLRIAYEAKDKPAAVKAYTQLIKTLPVAIGTFTYRRLTEPFVMKVYEFLLRPDLDDLLRKHAHLLTDGTKAEIGKVFVIESKGKGFLPVMSIAKKEWEVPMALLADQDFRNYMGVLPSNDRLFATIGTGGRGFMDPSSCQSKLSKMCKPHVSNHTHLRSRHFRSTFATNMGGMNLTYNSKKLLCSMMGHTLAVHELHYNIPQPLNMAAQMGFACHASAEDRIKNMHKMTIEDMVDMHTESTADPPPEVDM